MLLTVIIPVYNVEKYIEKCILSVVTNDLSVEEYEIIVVDDESPDNSVAIATNIAKGKTNIKIISQKNKGLGGARNTGLQHALGTYILFLDADDWYLPNKLKSILEKAIENKLDILEFGAQGIALDGEITYEKSISSNKIIDGIKYYNTVHYLNSACNKLYRRDLLISNKLFFLERIFIEDFEFNTRVFAKAKRVMATNFIVAQFLQSPNSITRNTDVLKKEKMINDILTVLQKTKTEYDKHISSSNIQTHFFYKERLGFIVTTLFYQLFKNKVSFQKMKEIKMLLVAQESFYIEHALFQKNKNLFRIIMLKNFWLFKITQPILNKFIDNT